MTWFAAAGDYDPQTLKATLNLAAVVLDSGTDLDDGGDGRWVGKCPFHDDEHESFAVWQWEDGAGAWACGCWACTPFLKRGALSGNGDLFDFLMAKYELSFPKAIELALQFKERSLPDPVAIGTPTGPAPDLGRQLERAKAKQSGLLDQLLSDRSVPVPATWIREHFGVEDGKGGEVLIPHWDEQGTLVAMKHRQPSDGWVNRTIRGGKLDALYGVWRTRGGANRPLVLCEGESDTWTVAYLLDGEPVDVVGLPSGASAGIKESWLEFVAGRRLTLLLDADRAGREGAGRWAVAAIGAGCDTRIACLPDGTDAATAGTEIVKKALYEAWSVVTPESLAIRIEDGRYVRPVAPINCTACRGKGYTGEDQDTCVPCDGHGKIEKPPITLSDFLLNPQRLVIMDDGGVVFECEVPGKQELQQLTDAELASTDKMKRWAAARMLSWKGTSRDISDLLELLKAQSILVPHLRGTDIIGLHNDVFVLPNKSIGASGWGYVPPENDIALGQALQLTEGLWDDQLPRQLVKLHHPQVVTPIIGWIAAAPLRSLVKKFPVLGVTGGSGWGKTTLLETILRAFGFWCTSPTTLTGTTPHALQSYVGSTNAFPIWIDEYRPGARIEAKLALDQIIRDSWDGSSTIKGGMSENRMQIKQLPARAPLVVTGEDSFSETSHSERMVMIPMEKDGRNPKALMTVQGMKVNGFGHAYLEWLLDSMRAGTIPAAPNIPDRKSQGRAVAEWGYELLTQFVHEVCHYELPHYDDTLAERAHNEIESTPVIVQAIIDAIGLYDGQGQPIALADGDDVLVKPQALCQWVHKNTDLKLPGGSKAVGKWLQQSFNAEYQKHPMHNRVLFVPGLLKDYNRDA